MSGVARLAPASRHLELVRRILAVDFAQHGLEADIPEAAVTHALRRRDSGVDDLLRRYRQRGAAGLRRHLDLTGPLQIMHQRERLGDAAALRQRAMIAQE